MVRIALPAVNMKNPVFTAFPQYNRTFNITFGFLCLVVNIALWMN